MNNPSIHPSQSSCACVRVCVLCSITGCRSHITKMGEINYQRPREEIDGNTFPEQVCYEKFNRFFRIITALDSILLDWIGFTLSTLLISSFYYLFLLSILCCIPLYSCLLHFIYFLVGGCDCYLLVRTATQPRNRVRYAMLWHIASYNIMLHHITSISVEGFI